MATILVVDDRADNRDLVATMLRYRGYRIVEAHDGEQALTHLRTNRSDLVLTDILMPGMDGYELVREMRADPTTAQIPVIFYTATYLNDEVAVTAEAYGVAATVVKGDGPQRLFDAVEVALRTPVTAAQATPDDALVRDHLRTVNAKLIQTSLAMEAKAAELHRSEQRFRRILEATNEGVWQIDADDRTVFVNHQMATMLGYSTEQMCEQPLWSFLSADRRAEARSALERRRAGVAERHEFCFTRSDGSDCYVLLSAAPVFGSDGGYEGALAVVTDLTTAGLAALPNAERFLATVTTNMEEGVLAVDTDGVVTFANAGALLMFDAPAGEIVGQDATTLLAASSDDKAGSALRTAWLDGHAVHEERVLAGPAEGNRAVSVRVWPQHNDGKVDGAVIILRDISARRAEQDRRARELEEIAWVGRTKDALDEGRLLLYAQPVVELATSRTVSHELLIRMRNSAGRLIGPGAFLPAAERYGLMPDIDAWVVGQAIPIIAAGNAVEINLSAKSIAEPDMLARIEAALRAGGVDPSLVTFEVTETGIMENMESAGSLVRGLRAMGCGVALDNFGTGSEGFAYLKHLPATKLKIDQQFVRGLANDQGNQHVVKAIVALARGFGQRVIAEGVEDPSCLDLLKQYGVAFAQGFFLGMPRPTDETWRRNPLELRLPARPSRADPMGSWSAPGPAAMPMPRHQQARPGICFVGVPEPARPGH